LVFDLSKGFEYWSDELFRIHGHDPAQGPLHSEQYLALVHPEDREFVASLMKRMLLDDSGFDVTKAHRVSMESRLYVAQINP
jgi:hypothetical protein